MDHYSDIPQEDKINPDLPIFMRLEYKLMDNPGLELVGMLIDLVYSFETF